MVFKHKVSASLSLSMDAVDVNTSEVLKNFSNFYIERKIDFFIVFANFYTFGTLYIKREFCSHRSIVKRDGITLLFLL